MIISEKYNFIFIHVAKAAGTSITRALRPYDDRPLLYKILDWKPLNVFPFFYRLNPYPWHITAAELRSKLGTAKFERLFTFAFVRNPWALQVSQYHYVKQTVVHPLNRSVRRMSFAEFLKWRAKEYRITQSEFVTDGDNQIIVDYIGKVETVQEDFTEICDRIGIDCHLPRTNTSKHRPYRKYYDEKLKQIVEDHFRIDIELFEYTFS